AALHAARQARPGDHQGLWQRHATGGRAPRPPVARPSRGADRRLGQSLSRTGGRGRGAARRAPSAGGAGRLSPRRGRRPPPPFRPCRRGIARGRRRLDELRAVRAEEDMADAAADRYSLTGPARTKAIAAGLAGAEWYRAPIPRAEMKALMQRSDMPALRDTLL